MLTYRVACATCGAHSLHTATTAPEHPCATCGSVEGWIRVPPTAGDVQAAEEDLARASSDLSDAALRLASACRELSLMRSGVLTR
jgi:hypothetical protein